MKQEFLFLWLIENYSISTVEGGVDLVSPEFNSKGLGGTSWSLLLNNSRYNFVREKSLCLMRSANDAGPDSFLLKFEISIIFDGSTLYTEEREHTFKMKSECDLVPLLNMVRLYKEKYTKSATSDTLCVRCRMWQGEGSVQLVKQCTARTRLGDERISYIHRVPNFSALKPNREKTLRIPSQSDGGCVLTSTIDISTFLLPTEVVYVNTVPSKRNYLLCKENFSLIDVSGNIIQRFEHDYRFLNRTLRNSQTRQFFLRKRKEYLPNDELSLLCEFTFFTGVECSRIEETLHDLPVMVYQQIYSIPQNKNDRKMAKKYSAHPSANENKNMNCNKQCLPNVELKANSFPTNNNAPSGHSFAIVNQVTYNNTQTNAYNAAEKLSICPSALEDFKALYNDQLFTDIELKTATNSFPAHKNVLCARSPVFRATLTNDMREKNMNCIRVEDLENDIVQRLLLFLYSDCVEKLQWESAIQLYYAADKYAVEKLKVLCSSFLVDNLSVSRASELLLLADMHSDAQLKQFVEDFILQHDKEVFDSAKWDKLGETNPQLVIKTMKLKYKREKGGK